MYARLDLPLPIYYIFRSCLRNEYGRSESITLLKMTKTAKFTKPAKLSCVQVAAQGVRATRSWAGTPKSLAARTPCAATGGVVGLAGRQKDEGVLVLLDGLQQATGAENSLNHYIFDSCLRNEYGRYSRKLVLKQAKNGITWSLAA